MGQSVPPPGWVVARGDVLGVWVEGARLLYDPASGRAHVLNDSAATIWGLLEVGSSLSEITEQIVRRFAGDRAQLATDVTSTIERFEAEGLLEPDPREPEPAPTTDAVSAVTRALRTSAFTLLDQVVSFALDDPTLAAAVEWFAAPLVTSNPPTRVCDLDMTIADARVFPAKLNRLTVETSRSTVVHAGAIVVGGAVVGLPAPPEAGKSTLVASLVRRGSGCMSDEAVGLQPSGLVVGYPKRIALETGSWPLFPDLDGDALHDAFDPSRVRWVDPRSLNPSALSWRSAAPTLELAVIPSFVPGTKVAVDRLEPLEAMTELLANSFNLPKMRASGLETLRDAAIRVPFYRLSHGHAEDASDAVVELMSDHGLDVP